MAKFTVDTHLFRELGELLVGRDSTALVELIKNAYDADATLVTVHGENLDDPENGKIVISDNGAGMTPDQFERGFLCIASRIKEGGTRRSLRFERRYTGAKGVGRLAAHKLACRMQVYSIPDEQMNSQGSGESVIAVIDWDKVESHRTLSELEGSDALVVQAEPRDPEQESGTIMELQYLRRKWTESERTRLFWEVQTFQPAEALVCPPSGAVSLPLLFDTPRVNDANSDDKGFKVALTGDFEVGEEYWQSVLESAFWVVEILASREDGKVTYRITPTTRCLQDNSDAHQQTYVMDHPDPENGPFFESRILIREGSGNFGTSLRGWVGRNAGIRVYMEGFRVLPYGEKGDDWLEINADFKRTRTFRHLDPFEFPEDEISEKDATYMFLRGDAYFGGVFLTASEAPSLRMLVNREGFIPDSGFETLAKLVRTATDLSVRHRALAYRERRLERRARRAAQKQLHRGPTVSRLQLQATVEQTVSKASELASSAREKAQAWEFDSAQKLIEEAAAQFDDAGKIAEQLVTEPTTLRIIASVGLQMAAFVTEINGILGLANDLDKNLKRIRKTGKYYPAWGTVFSRLHTNINRLRHGVERPAAYLTEVTAPDGHRRRSRQKFHERLDVAVNTVSEALDQRKQTLGNDIPKKLQGPPMFRAETAMVFANLLSNAIKAAGQGGRIRVAGREEEDGVVVLTMENTGEAIDLKKSEEWFRPFMSTTIEVDPVLGQGMGMGLAITRDMLGEYGAAIAFVEPSAEFATAIEIRFPPQDGEEWADEQVPDPVSSSAKEPPPADLPSVAETPPDGELESD